MRDWVPKHFDFAGYVIGEHPQAFGPRAELRKPLGYRPDERVCIVTVGGSGVGTHLIRRILQSYPMARANLPELRMILVAGPRIDPRLAQCAGRRRGARVRAGPRPPSGGVRSRARARRPHDLHGADRGRHAVPLFPAQNHFEQNFHVAHRLDRYGAGRRMDYATSTPDMIADAMVAALKRPTRFKAVESDGARRAARMLAELI